MGAPSNRPRSYADEGGMKQGGDEIGRFGAWSQHVIGACIEVHRELGPGLLESAYEQCLAYELSLRRLRFERQVPLPVRYKGVALACGYRVDFVVERSLVVEIKAVEQLLPVHEAQVVTYLKLLNLRTGLLVNFHSATIKRGLRRLTQKISSSPPSPFKQSSTAHDGSGRE